MKTINNYIDESLTKSYDSNILIKKLKNKYKEKINNIHIQKSKSNVQSFSIQFDEQYMYDIVYDESLYKLLDLFGYYVTEYKEIKTENNQILRFEPIFGQKCNDLVYKECNGVIYHITDDKFIDKIRKKGLIPFRNSNYRNFSDRVFFSCGKNKKEIIDNLKNVIKQLEKINYHILKIDLNKYKYNVDFYFDPSEDDKHNYIYANAYFYPHMIDEIKDLETLINENYKEVILPNGQQIKLQIL